MLQYIPLGYITKIQYLADIPKNSLWKLQVYQDTQILATDEPT